MAKDKPKGERMYGGLIRPRKNITRDEHGAKLTEHWSGRKDVEVQARPVRIKTQLNGSD